MKDLSYYVGREQTYLKHFFLENYLERVAYNIFSFLDEFVYVDGFSGPWRTQDGKYEDTSFVIAINTLEKIRQSVHEQRGKTVKIRYIFIENDPTAFSELKIACANFPGLNIQAWPGDFQSLIPRICDEVRRAFSLTFIDPTGWTGFPLLDLRPIFRLRGEFIINFMFDHISRFLDHPGPEIAKSFDPVFGTSNWRDNLSASISSGSSREDAILETYVNGVRTFGNVPFVTSTRIKKPLADRSYFHLVYGTKSWKGIFEFRKVERRAVAEQEQVRDAAKHKVELERTGQDNFWGALHPPGAPKSFEDERRQNVEKATNLLPEILKANGDTSYEDALGRTLEIPLVWETDFRRILFSLRENGSLKIVASNGDEVNPKSGARHRIIWIPQ